MKKKQEVIGRHNQRLALGEFYKGDSYKKVSTLIFVPAISDIPTKVVSSWMNLMKPMNQLTAGLYFLENMEVGDAYEKMITILRTNPGMKDFKYVMTLETDNIVPPDALLKLQEDIEAGPFDAVGSLYWTKGETGKPMCYGRTDVVPKDFIPWLPPQNVVAPCNGLGMGCTLFRMSMLLDEKFERPMFKTVQQHSAKGIELYTQDLKFFENAAKLGYRFACSTRTLTGHYDKSTDITW